MGSLGLPWAPTLSCPPPFVMTDRKATGPHQVEALTSTSHLAFRAPGARRCSYRKAALARAFLQGMERTRSWGSGSARRQAKCHEAGRRGEGLPGMGTTGPRGRPAPRALRPAWILNSALDAPRRRKLCLRLPLKTGRSGGTTPDTGGREALEESAQGKVQGSSQSTWPVPRVRWCPSMVSAGLSASHLASDRGWAGCACTGWASPGALQLKEAAALGVDSDL